MYAVHIIQRYSSQFMGGHIFLILGEHLVCSGITGGVVAGHRQTIFNNTNEHGVILSCRYLRAAKHQRTTTGQLSPGPVPNDDVVNQPPHGQSSELNTEVRLL